MSEYHIKFKPSVEKDLRIFPYSLLPVIMSKIEELKINPFPPQTKKITSTKKTYRLRIREYRIIYEVDTENKIITILYIRHRGDVYKKI